MMYVADFPQTKHLDDTTQTVSFTQQWRSRFFDKQCHGSTIYTYLKWIPRLCTSIARTHTQAHKHSYKGFAHIHMPIHWFHLYNRNDISIISFVFFFFFFFLGLTIHTIQLNNFQFIWKWIEDNTRILRRKHNETNLFMDMDNWSTGITESHFYDVVSCFLTMALRKFTQFFVPSHITLRSFCIRLVISRPYFNQLEDLFTCFDFISIKSTQNTYNGSINI